MDELYPAEGDESWMLQCPPEGSHFEDAMAVLLGCGVAAAPDSQEDLFADVDFEGQAQFWDNTVAATTNVSSYPNLYQQPAIAPAHPAANVPSWPPLYQQPAIAPAHPINFAMSDNYDLPESMFPEENVPLKPDSDRFGTANESGYSLGGMEQSHTQEDIHGSNPFDSNIHRNVTNWNWAGAGEFPPYHPSLFEDSSKLPFHPANNTQQETFTPFDIPQQGYSTPFDIPQQGYSTQLDMSQQGSSAQLVANSGLVFNSIADAKGTTVQNPPSISDPTFPANPEEDASYVLLMVEAMKDMSVAEDNDGVIAIWRTAMRDGRKVEKTCWMVLDLVKQTHITAALVSQKAPRQHYGKLGDRIQDLCDGFRTQKTMCKHLMGAPYMETIVDNPKDAVSRIKNNRKVNKGKKDTIEKGREAMGLKSVGKGRRNIKIEQEGSELDAEGDSDPEYADSPYGINSATQSSPTGTPPSLHRLKRARAARSVSDEDFDPSSTPFKKTTPRSTPRSVRSKPEPPAPGHGKVMRAQRSSTLAAINPAATLQRRALNAGTPSRARRNFTAPDHETNTDERLGAANPYLVGLNNAFGNTQAGPGANDDPFVGGA